MRLIPGNYHTPTAGPILCPGAPLISPDGKERTIAKSVDGSAHVYPAETRTWHSTLTTVWSLDLTADLGPTVALRWLGRHYEIEVGFGCPRFTPLPDGAGWMLVSDVGDWVFFVPKPPMDPERFGARFVVISLPTNIHEAIAAACAYAAGVTR